MKLAPNWKTIARRAWSFRFMGAAALLSGMEVVVPLLDGYLPIPPGVFAGLAGAISAAALIARLVAQQGITPEPAKATSDVR